jgi:predicted  nucleic acid-binding Zn-ribbon protein
MLNNKMHMECKNCGDTFDHEVKQGKLPSSCLECNPRRKWPRYAFNQKERRKLDNQKQRIKNVHS